MEAFKNPVFQHGGGKVLAISNMELTSAELVKLYRELTKDAPPNVAQAVDAIIGSLEEGNGRTLLKARKMLPILLRSEEAMRRVRPILQEIVFARMESGEGEEAEFLTTDTSRLTNDEFVEVFDAYVEAVGTLLAEEVCGCGRADCRKHQDAAVAELNRIRTEITKNAKLMMRTKRLFPGLLEGCSQKVHKIVHRKLKDIMARREAAECN